MRRIISTNRASSIEPRQLCFELGLELRERNGTVRAVRDERIVFAGTVPAMMRWLRERGAIVERACG